ncbi:hypothetical protein PYJP_07560 [Pyrofollis japonicus]|uniref:B3/B4 domain-containing protein n=1 Tax=Pyrofollis japonicus TaxID=3060460 RepID=UPI00295B7383|nr:phenylalanine--tRNA ligase beta subunit-related protein [Pyrofollis japonicus]BEP17404.1 hypothetical protein PYJP_07560 [Pyrofollis japonicus]
MNNNETDICRDLEKLLHVDNAAAALGIRVAFSASWGKAVEELSGEPLRGEEEALMNYLRSRYRLEELKDDPIVRAYRDFYWRIGIDPTKTRPSSEALVRRALRGSWPRINPVVDAGNIASAKFMVPVGLYDLDSFVPPARIVLARGDEVFEPIGGRKETVRENAPIMIDKRGVVMHLYPHRDSRITMIRNSTRRILIVAAGVPRVNTERLVATVEEVKRLLGRLGWQSCKETIVKP